METTLKMSGVARFRLTHAYYLREAAKICFLVAGVMMATFIYSFIFMNVSSEPFTRVLENDLHGTLVQFRWLYLLGSVALSVMAIHSLKKAQRLEGRAR